MRLHDINLTRRRPSTVSFVLRKQPDGWPDEVTLRELGLHLDLAVLEAEITRGSDSSRLDWIDDVAGCGSVLLATLEGIAGAFKIILTAPYV